MLKKIFFEMFMCLLLKGYNKDHRIELMIWLHSKLFIPYITYSNKPRKRYVLDTRFLLTKIPVIFTTLISGFTWVVFGLFTELERLNCWLSQYVSCYSFFFFFFFLHSWKCCCYLSVKMIVELGELYKVDIIRL